MKKYVFALSVVASLLSACGSKVEPTDFKTLEDARNQARENAEFNAQGYRAENPRFDGSWKLVTHGDSTQSPNCPQGDGWASLSIMQVKKADPSNPANKDTVEKIKIKCSTVSGALGCYTEDDFYKKPFAQDENKCQDTNKVPFPLPKIAK